MLGQMGKRPGGNPRAAFSFGSCGGMRGQPAKMTINFSSGDKPPVDMLAITEIWLREAAENLAVTVQSIKSGEFGQVKDAVDCIKGLKVAVHLAIEEGNRVEKLRKQVAGACGSGTFDMDAARDEIGRRLARLRDAGGD
jgi:hypothetical protein